MNFAFLSISLLGALALCTVPLIIHLISRRQPRRVPFAAIEFVLRSQKRTARDWKLQKLLLLLTRTLLIAIFALAIALPILRKEQKDKSKSTPLATLVVVDASGSMLARVDGRSRFSKALRIAEDLIEDSAKETQTALMRCGISAEMVAPPSFRNAQLLEQLRALPAGYGAADMSLCIEAGVGALSRVKGEGEKHLVVVGDLAEHGFSTPIKAPPIDGLVLRFISTDDDELPNHALHSVEVNRRGDSATGDVEVRFSVANFSKTKNEIDVDLFVGEQHVSQRQLDVKEDTPFSSSFFFHGSSYLISSANDDSKKEVSSRHTPPSVELGHEVLRLVASDDALEEDNILHTPLGLPSAAKVLLIDGAPQPIPFRDEVYYLESALQKSAAHRPPVALQIIHPSDLKVETLLDTDVVILANVPRFADDLARGLVTFVKNGGGLLITSGDQVDVQWMNHAFADVLPGRLRGEKENEILDDNEIVRTLSFSGFDKRHPIFRNIRSDDKDVVKGLAQAQTSTLMLLEPDARISKKILMYFDNGAPALVERRVEEGRVLLWLTSIDRDWSDTAIRPGYLPLVQQMVFHIADALKASHSLEVEVGQVLQLPVPRGATSLEVLFPDGKRESLEVPEAKADSDEGIAFHGTQSPGIYRVFVKRGEGEAQEMLRDRFAVRLPLSESDLKKTSEETLRKLAPRGARVEGGPEEKDTPLWPFLLFTLPFLFLLESLLVRKS
ncbi:MAG: VWA domain-containing protein [Deltaproteobacteria bacterium]|nr:VWA domain-containing protein [Deltaproteobacteria bacterium]